MKATLRHLFVTFIVCSFAFGILNLLIDNPYSQKLIGIYVNKLITQETYLSVSFESLEFKLYPLEVNLFGVQAHSTSPADEGTRADAIQVKIRISILSLIFGEPKISVLHLNSLNLHIPNHFEGHFLKKVKPLRKYEESKWPIQKLSLENTQISLDFSSQNNPNSHIHVSGFDGLISFKDWDQFKGPISINSVNLTHRGKDLFVKTHLSSDIQLQHDRIQLKNLNIKNRLLNINSNVSGTLALRHGSQQYLRINGQSHIEADLSVLENWLDWKKTHGQAKVDAKLLLNIPFSNMSDTSFVADGQLEAIDAYLSNIRIYDTKSQFSANNNELRFKHAKITIQNKEYSDAHGSIQFNDAIDVDFKGSVKDFALSQIISSFDSKFEDVDFQTYSNNISVAGTGDPLKLKITGQAELANLRFPTIKIERTRYQDIPACYGNLNLLVTEQRLNFNDTDVTCFIPPGNHQPNAPTTKSANPPKNSQFTSTIQVREYIDFDEGPHLSLIANNLNLALSQSYLQTDLGGYADIVSRIYENKHKLSIVNTIASKNVYLMKIPLGTLTSTVEVLNDSLVWKTLKLSNENMSVHSDYGSYNWNKNFLSFHTDAEKIPKDLVKSVLTQLPNKDVADLNFSVEHLDGDFEIPLSQWSALKLNLTSKLNDLSYKDDPLLKELSFTNTTENKHFHFSELNAYFGSLHMTGDVQYTKHDFNQLFSPLDELNLQVKSSKASSDENHFNDFMFLNKELEALQLKGTANLDASVKGKLSQLSGFFNADFSQLSAQNYPLYPFTVKGFINQSQLQLYLRQSGDNLLSRMDFDFSKEDVPFHWFFNFKQFDLRPFAHTILNKDARNYAYLSAQWEWEGNLKTWWNSKGYLNLEDMTLSYLPPSNMLTEPIRLKSTGPAKVLMNARSWTFENEKPFTLSGLLGNLSIDLKNSVPKKQLGLVINGTLNLAPLSKLSPSILSSEGLLAVETKIEGPFNDLKIKSHIFDKPKDLSHSSMFLSIADLSPSFQDIHIDVYYENGQFLVKNISAQKGKGQVQVNGHYNLLTKEPSEIKINFDDFALDLNLPYLKTIHTVLGGNLVISGTERPYPMEGHIKILKAETDRYLDIEAEILREYSNPHFGSSFQQSQKPVFLFNVAIEANKSINIKSQSFSSLLSSKILLKGSNEVPVLSGPISVDKGKFRYKRDFTIMHGELVFDNPLRNDPKLNVVARAQIGTYGVTIYITGESSKPLVDIVVDPATKDDGSAISRLDAIVLLSTGRLPQTTETRSQDARGLVLSTGLNLYASQLPFEKFNELTGQKYISPYVNYTTDDQGNPVPQLNVPIHISDLIEAIVQQIPNKISATLQVPLHDNISLSGSASSTRSGETVQDYNNQTESAVDLKFAFPFK